MLWAIYSDLTRRILSNKLCLATSCLYPFYLGLTHMEGHGLPLSDILISLALSGLIFAVCAGFFALGVMGGGDVKFIPIVALWAGTSHILNFLLITAMVGGLFAAAIIIQNRLKASKYFKSSENINLSMAKERESEVPYGVGIAMGGLYVACQLFIAY